MLLSLVEMLVGGPAASWVPFSHTRDAMVVCE
jgi:hypothetical protein